MKVKKIVRIICIVLAAVIVLAVLTVGGYVAYVAAQYYRIEDNVVLEVSGSTQTSVVRGEQYSVMSYNLGFGAYSPEYSFFMDTGVMDDGREVAAFTPRE